MNQTQAPMQLDLQYRALFSLTDAAGVRIDCDAGSVWLTLDNDPRDIVLEAGESFATPQHRRALIYAMEPSRLRLRCAAAQKTECGIQDVRPSLQPAFA